MRSGLWQRWLGWLQGLVIKRWFVPLVALMAATDSLLVVFPVDALLITRVLFRRSGWLSSALLIALGSAGGTFLLGGLIQSDVSWIWNLVSEVRQHTGWENASHLIQTYGWIGVGVIAASFIPLQIGVVVAAIERVPLLSIAMGALTGRVIKYVGFAALCAYSPGILRKLGIDVDSIRRQMNGAVAGNHPTLIKPRQ